jgi:hypothetical protein
MESHRPRANCSQGLLHKTNWLTNYTINLLILFCLQCFQQLFRALLVSKGPEPRPAPSLASGTQIERVGQFETLGLFPCSSHRLLFGDNQDDRTG